MSLKEEKKKEFTKWIGTSSVSIAIHIFAFISIAYLSKLSLQSAVVNPKFLSLEFQEYSIPIDLKESNEDTGVEKNNDVSAEKDLITEPGQFFFKDIDADTTNLDQIYKESSLNVSIKYPKGWTFIDQNIKNKLDGVTFWATDGLYEPPPYIHLEVREKYYFDARKFEYMLDLDDCVAYYNDPEVMEEYYIQNVYLRTEASEDFNIKLIVVGKEAFTSFKPKFFGMIKTFDFGSSFF